MATVTKPIALDESFNTTETPSRNIADVLASLGDAISQGAQPVTKKLATNSFKTINGGLVDGLTVQFTPVQDLHGYSKPWAGGAGKNKLPNNGVSTYTAGSLTFTKQADGSVLVNGTNDTGNTVNYFFNVENTQGGTPCFATLPEGTYTLTGCPTGGGPGSWSYALQLFYGGSTSNTYGDSFATNFDFGEGMTVVANSGNNSNVGCRICVADGKTVNNLVFKPMLRLASIADPTFEPYSNICPISGHTEAKAKINDTVYTTSLGTTAYGGEVEQVSGAGESTFIDTPLDLSSLPFTYNPSWGGSGVFSIASSLPDIKAPTSGSVAVNALCEIYKIYSRDELFNSPSIDGYAVSTSGQLLIRDHRFTNAPSFISAMSGVETIYELDTPTTLTLTGQNITAEVGENNVSAPLDGQNIKTDSVIYKDMFTWEDVLKVI